MKKEERSVDERYGELVRSSIEGAEKIGRLGELSERLGGLIGKALDDGDQFKRYIVSEKAKNGDGELCQTDVEKVFEKVDFKSVKEAACAIKALADSMRAIYSLPDVDIGNDASPSVTVAFRNGEEYAG
ncbi:MAG: hypothetical protein IJV00_03090 [Clostridia bacterium]|nr:hypothetical protein [Clostridia bacterium]